MAEKKPKAPPAEPTAPPPQNNGALVPTAAPGNALAPMEWDVPMLPPIESIPAGRMVCSLRPNNREEAEQVKRMWKESDCTASDLVGQVVAVRHLLIHSVRRVSRETGEESVQPRIVLLLDDGRVVSTSSESLYRAIAVDSAVDGRFPPFDPPYKVKIAQRKASDGVGKYLTTESAD